MRPAFQVFAVGETASSRSVGRLTGGRLVPEPSRPGRWGAARPCRGEGVVRGGLRAEETGGLFTALCC